jgi:hypothetical protein
MALPSRAIRDGQVRHGPLGGDAQRRLGGRGLRLGRWPHIPSVLDGYGGEIWGAPQPVADHGVAPTAAIAGNVHVVGYGRSANWLAFFADGGVPCSHCYAPTHDRYDGSEYKCLVALSRRPSDPPDLHRLMTSYFDGSVLATFISIRTRSLRQGLTHTLRPVPPWRQPCTRAASTICPVVCRRRR